MKTAKEWVDECSQSGPFDLVNSSAEAEIIVRKIQEDAINSELAKALPIFQEIKAELNKLARKLKVELP